MIRVFRTVAVLTAVAAVAACGTPATTTAAAGSSAVAAPTTSSAAPVTTSAAPGAADPHGGTAAAAILKASDQHYRDEFHQGQAIIGHTQYADATAGIAAMDDPTSAAARFRDYRQNPGPERDLSGDDAFRQADAHFTADTEPQAIRDWQTDLTPLTSDLSAWVLAAADYQIQGKTQADLDAAAAKVEQDLAKLDADAAAIAGS